VDHALARDLIADGLTGSKLAGDIVDRLSFDPGERRDDTDSVSRTQFQSRILIRKPFNNSAHVVRTHAISGTALRSGSWSARDQLETGPWKYER
jgi:hypothetical protein